MDIVSYKCPNCGGPLTFDADKQIFDCDYCCSEFSEQELIARFKEHDDALGDNENDRAEKGQQAVNGQENVSENSQQFSDNMNNEEREKFENEAVYYICPSCGAEIVTTDTTAATECFYCQNPVVLSGRLSGDYKPDCVIPFAVSRDKAIEKFSEVCRKKKFLPVGFWQRNQIEKVTGVYFPYWYADDEADISATARCEKVRSWTSGDKRYTETEIYRVVRDGDAQIENMIRGALSKEDAFLLKYVHPYDLSKIRDFSMTYLAGYQAEKRDIEKSAIEKDIDAESKRRCENAVRDTMKQYTSVRMENFYSNIKKRKWRYTLLPVWMVTYKYMGKIYVYGMNGQTGKIYGELPMSKKKVAMTALIMGLIIIALGAIGGMFI